MSPSQEPPEVEAVGRQAPQSASVAQAVTSAEHSLPPPGSSRIPRVGGFLFGFFVSVRYLVYTVHATRDARPPP